ncbi:hypothetical protein FBU31_004103, partial [Coemansia sp. 'formosensis']
GMPGFESHAQSTLHGLPLQNPSQVSIPMDIQSQQFAMQHFSSAPSHGFGNSAIGIPISEHATYYQSAPVTAHPSQSIGGMDNMLGNVLPIDLHGNQQFIHQSHAYHAVPPYAFSPPHTMPVNNGHLQPLPLHARNRQPSRTRAITADSHTLARMSRLNDPSFNDSMADYASGFKPMLDLGPQSRYTPGDEHIPAHVDSSSVSPTEDISVDALLASRRRRLEDARTIARTNAQRGKHVSNDMPFGHLSTNDESLFTLGVNDATITSGVPPSVNMASTARMVPSSSMVLPPQMYHSISGNPALHQSVSNASHSQDACVAPNAPDHTSAPLVPGVSSSEADMMLSAGTDTYSLEQCQILDNILSQCGAMNILQNVGGQDQVLNDSGPVLDTTNSSDELGELNEHHTSQLDENSKLTSTLFSSGIGLLTKRAQPSYQNGVAAQNCFVTNVPSISPSANDESETNAMLASSFLLAPSTTSIFHIDPTQYAPNLANPYHAPIADSASAKYQSSNANLVSVAANGQVGQRDLTIEQLHQYSSM